MRYMDRGNYIKRNGYCSTISCETKGQKTWWKKIERKNGRWNGKSGRKICECRWLVSDMLNTITIDSFNLFVLFKYCNENKFVDAFSSQLITLMKIMPDLETFEFFSILLHFEIKLLKTLKSPRQSIEQINLCNKCYNQI